MNRYRFSTGPGEKAVGVNIGFCFDIYANSRKEAVEKARTEFDNYEFHTDHVGEGGRSLDVSLYVNQFDIDETDIVEEEELDLASEEVDP